MYKPAVAASAIFGMLAVILGAFGAHARKERLSPELLDAFEAGVKYQMFHSIALLGVCLAFAHLPASWVARAAWMLIIGVNLFIGSIHALVGMRRSASVVLRC